MRTVYKRRMTADAEVIEMALVGYLQRAREINQKMQDIQSQVDELISPSARPPHKKHRISPEGRARIAAAQRKRWAASKKLEAASRG